MKTLSVDTYEALYKRLTSIIKACGDNYRDALMDVVGVYEELVAMMLDGEMRVFGSSYSRVIYACRNSNVDASIERLCGEFHRRVRHIGESECGRNELMTALSTLCHIIEAISHSKIPHELMLLIENYPVYELRNASMESGLISIMAVVDSISGVEYDENGRYYTLGLLLEDRDRENYSLKHKIELQVRENAALSPRDDLFDVRELIREYDCINVTSIMCDGKDRYSTTQSSLIILEPDYLVDVTDLAACFTSNGYNENLFFLSKFSTDNDSESMLKGTLVNDVLDASLEGEEVELDEVFRNALSKNILKSIRYGGEVVKNIWQEVGRYHWANIERFSSTLRNRRVTVEPSFISPLYGIQGRLDVIVEYDNYPLRKDVYELKSGKAPSGGSLWRANAMQVACYNMLLESTYGKDRRGTSAVLYSMSATSPLRNYLSTLEDKILVCALRNHIVRNVYDMACGDFSLLEKINIEQIGDYQPYVRARIEDFAKFYTSISPTRRAYYHTFLSFYIREMICVKTGAMGGADRDRRDAYSRLWRAGDEEKIRNFAILPSLRYVKSDKENSRVEFEICREVEHSFRIGDVVILYPHKEGLRDAHLSQVLKGVLRDVDDSRVVVELRGKVYERYMSMCDNWAMEHDVMEKGYWSAMASLKDFVGGDSVSSRVIFGEREPKVSSSNYSWRDNLTSNQNQCVEKALKTDDFFLLQGPPGTGKTSGAIMAMVSHVLSSTSDTLTLLAYTNRAVDELGTKLRAAGIDYLRIGHENASAGEKTLSVISANRKINEVKNIVSSQRVFLSTVSAFAVRANDLSSVVRLEQVIVDEASQLTEIQLVGVLGYFKKWVLVGDQMQLPSVVAQSETFSKVDDEDLKGICLEDMRASLFERLQSMLASKGIESHSAMLDTHFRMHEDIAAAVNGFYNGELRSGSERQKKVIDKPRLVYCPSSHEDSYKKHISEAKKVVSLLSEIKAEYKENFTGSTVGVVTPFRAQIAVIRDMIKDEELKEKVIIDTVERFQGGERDIIIASMAVSSEGQMKMIRSVNRQESVDRKLNVMVSRSRERFILLGEREPLCSDKFYKALLERCSVVE